VKYTPTRHGCSPPLPEKSDKNSCSDNIRKNDPEAAGIDLSFLAHVSPIEWTNVILYGEYKLNRELVK
jgi:hypothetical protein